MGKRIRENLAAVLPISAAISFWLPIADSFFIVNGSTKLLGGIASTALVLTYSCLATLTVTLFFTAVISILVSVIDRDGRPARSNHSGRVIGILLFLIITASSYSRMYGLLLTYKLVDPRAAFPIMGILFVACLVARVAAISIGRIYNPSAWDRMLGGQYALAAGTSVFVFGTMMSLYRSTSLSMPFDGGDIIYYPIFLLAGIIAWAILSRLFRFLSNRNSLFTPGLIVLLIIITLLLFVRPAAPDNPDVHNPNLYKRGRNVVLISIDTLRYDRLHCNGNETIETPSIDTLSEQSINFDNCIVPMPITVPSHCSMMTGLTPRNHGVRSMMSPLADSHLTLAEILAQEGFTCGGFTAVSLISGQNSALDQGFHYYDDYWIFEGESVYFPREVKYSYAGRILNKFLAERITTLSRFERRAEPTVDSAIRWLEYVKDEDFFCFIHVFDPHWDYDAPEPYTVKYDPGYDSPLSEHPNPQKLLTGHTLKLNERDINHLAARYDGEVTYTDHHLGRFFDKLRDLGLWDETMIILTADHGESFEHDYYFGHNDRVFQSTIHVPLMIKPFAGTGGERTDTLCSNTDFLPTICDVLGLPAPSGLDGVSLAGFMNGTAAEDEQAHPYVFSETYFVDGNPQNYGKMYSINRGMEKLISSPYGYPYVPKYQYYNLDIDRGENLNLYEMFKGDIVDLTLLLDGWADADEDVLGEATGLIERENLKSLQYLN